MGKRLVNVHAFLSLRCLMYQHNFGKERIARLQLKKLKKLLIYSYKNFEFYRQRMDSCGLDPYKIQDIKELEKLPILTKKEYRAFTKEIVNKNQEKYNSWYSEKTSGSTGIPLEVIRSWSERGHMIARWLRELNLNGFRSTDHSFRTVVPSRLNNKKDVILQHFGLFKRTLIPYSFSEKKIVEAYMEANPDFFYASQVEAILIAKYILKNNIQIKKPRIYSVGAAMIDKNSRVLLDKVFGKNNFFETYACEETGVLAFQIKGSKGLHFSHDTNILELQSEDGSIHKDEGHCLITDLGIYSFPLIRYQLGDYLKTYTDENGFQKIEKIIGRLDDWLIWKDGTRSGMGSFYEIMSHFSSEISQYRVIQENYELVRILISLSPLINFDMESKEKMKEKIITYLKTYMRSKIEYRIEFVDKIPPDKNRKIRMVISKVDQKE